MNSEMQQALSLNRNTYGTAKCVECGVKFTKASTVHKVCAMSCQIQRDKRKVKEWRARKKAKEAKIKDVK